MNKKGMTWSTIVYAIIAVIVLITLVWIFQEQITEVYKGMMGILNPTVSGVEDAGKAIEELVK
jgi:hypothetical protein